ncbi:hypothetical protein RhiirA1_480581, partial [Rhizophagus irregularis]
HSSVSLDAHSGQKLLIESERFNNTPSRVPFTIEELKKKYLGPNMKTHHFEVSSLDFEGRVSVYQISRRPVSRIPLDVDFG